MTTNATEAMVGGVVLAGALAFAIYAGQATGYSKSTSGYDLHASFRSLEGVSVGTDVRLAGIKIGTVKAMDLDLDTYRAAATFSIRDGIELPDDSAIVVSSEGLLGGQFVEVMPGGSPFYLAPGDEITDTQGSVSVISLLLKFVAGNGSTTQ